MTTLRNVDRVQMIIVMIENVIFGHYLTPGANVKIPNHYLHYISVLDSAISLL